MTATGLESRTTQFVNEHSTIWTDWPNDWAVFWVLVSTVHLTVCSCHVTYALQSESTLYSCLNVKELLAGSRRKIWNLNDSNWTRTQNHLVHKRTLNHLASLAKWLSCVLSTYLYSAFDCIRAQFTTGLLCSLTKVWWKALKLWEIAKNWSLEQTGPSYNQKCVFSFNLRKKIWNRVKKIQSN